MTLITIFKQIVIWKSLFSTSASVPAQLSLDSPYMCCGNIFREDLSPGIPRAEGRERKGLLSIIVNCFMSFRCLDLLPVFFFTRGVYCHFWILNTSVIASHVQVHHSMILFEMQGLELCSSHFCSATWLLWVSANQVEWGQEEEHFFLPISNYST